MSDIAAGWVPAPGSLATPAGCDAALAEIGVRKVALNEQMQTRPANDKLPYVAELARLAALRTDIKKARARLVGDEDPERFNKAFRALVREHVGESAYADLIEQTKAVVLRYESQPSTVAHARAIEPLGGGGGLRTRKEDRHA